ncbi:hypothetical protein [Belnapia sp. F-4-1]|uniref:hypothetical protein n=1 Tax=Belnapia sp. F-4-1 TaxID=1545443 RepID=UPI00068ECE4A|nr:hypothetical protein [Belnapia sp. F-4-1]
MRRMVLATLGVVAMVGVAQAQDIGERLGRAWQEFQGGQQGPAQTDPRYDPRLDRQPGGPGYGGDDRRYSENDRMRQLDEADRRLDAQQRQIDQERRQIEAERRRLTR